MDRAAGLLDTMTVAMGQSSLLILLHFYRRKITKYANYTNAFAVKSSSDMMRETVNLDPSCNVDLREKATNRVCACQPSVYCFEFIVGLTN